MSDDETQDAVEEVEDAVDDQPTGAQKTKVKKKSFADDGRHHIDFPKLWRPTLIGSGIAVAVSILALIIGGLNLGIDFEGGTSFEVLTDASVDEVSATLPPDVASDARIQEVIDDQGVRLVRVRSSVEEPAAVESLRGTLSTIGEITTFESVGPTFGQEVTNKAIRALVFFFIAIAIYISIRLEWKMAVGALTAVAHDIIISVGVYAIFRFEVTPATVIAFLTIMGYSLYDTIVVYDKVREITARVGATGRYTYTEMMNLSLNQVLTRSINTTITSVIPVLSMLIIGSLILGATTLQEFSIALLVGLLVGGYSSIFIAASVVALLKEREVEYQQIATKVEKRSGVSEGTREISGEDARAGDAPIRQRSGTATKSKAPPRPTKSKSKASSSGKSTTSGGTTVPPRPRKTKKRK